MPSHAATVVLTRDCRPDLRGDLARRVGQKHLFGKADAEARRAVERLGGVKLPVVDLGRDIRIADDRPGDQLREERDVEQELCERALRRNITAPDVDRIGKRLKGIEGDADGSAICGTGMDAPKPRSDSPRKSPRI